MTDDAEVATERRARGRGDARRRGDDDADDTDAIIEATAAAFALAAATAAARGATTAAGEAEPPRPAIASREERVQGAECIFFGTFLLSFSFFFFF